MNLTQLPPYQKRGFVPADANLTDVQVVTGLYRQLIDRSIASAAQLESWLLDRSELDAALGQALGV